MKCPSVRRIAQVILLAGLFLIDKSRLYAQQTSGIAVPTGTWTMALTRGVPEESNGWEQLVYASAVKQSVMLSQYHQYYSEVNESLVGYNFDTNSWAVIDMGGLFHTENIPEGGESQGYFGYNPNNNTIVYHCCTSGSNQAEDANHDWWFDVLGQSGLDKHTSPKPPASALQPAGAFDAAHDKFVFEGGDSFVGTWTYDPTNNVWEKMTTNGPGPNPSLILAGMAYSTAGQQVYLFGGFDGTNYYSDLYSYNIPSNTWTLITPAGGVTPPGRYRFGFAYDSLNNVFVLYGGENASGILGDTWVFDPTTSTWTELTPSQSPPIAASPVWARLAYDSDHNAFVLAQQGQGGYFGGTWTPYAIQTWLFRYAGPGPNAGTLASTVSPSVGGLNRNASSWAKEPVIASSGTALYAAWAETSSPFDQSNDSTPHIYASQYIAGNWVPLGQSYNSISVDRGEAHAPSMTVVGSTPWLSWYEADDFSYIDVAAAGWNGTTWPKEAIGLVTSSSHQGRSQIADVGGVPYIAFLELNKTYDPQESLAYVKAWNGTSWALLGTAPLNRNEASGTFAESISIATDGTYPYVAWTEYVQTYGGSSGEDTDTHPQVYAAAWSGSAWVALGGSLNVNSANWASDASIAYLGGQLYVAWTERTESGNAQLYVETWNGSSWVLTGSGSLNQNSATGWAYHPSLVADSPTNGLYLGWVEQGAIGQKAEVYVSQYIGGAWISLGAALNVNSVLGSAQRVSLAVYNGQPVAAWGEVNPGSLRQIYVEQWNGSAWIQLSGTGGGPDTTAPSVPANLTAVPASSTQINLAWSPSTDLVGVAGYLVYRGGSQVANITTSYSYEDTGLSQDTAYSYTVAAYDTAGNVSGLSKPASATTTGSDTTPPVISITAPVNGASVGGTVTLTANATDNIAVASVQFQLDGTNLGNTVTGPGPKYSISWNTTTAANESHALSGIATDTSGNTAVSSIAVTVNNVVLQAPISTGQVGVTYSSSLVAAGGTPPYTFSITAGSLPTGLTLTTGTGAITGTPSAAGTFNFTAKVTDSTSGTPLTTSINSSITIAPAPLMLQAPAGAGQVGTAYSSSLVAGGGTPPYTFSITSGSLPTGLTLTAGTGAITGTPGAAGTFTFTAKVTDSTSGTPLTTSLNCTITIAPAPLTLHAPSGAGQVGTAYSSSLVAGGGTSPYTFSITTGSLPTGLMLTASTGAITGTPSAAGTFSFTATVTDSTSGTPLTTSLNCSITISTGPVPLLLIQGGASELSGVTNGSIVTPAIGPSAFTGTVVVNGTGSVNFAPAQSGNGVYFLNCCTNTNNAYYKFAGIPVGNIFNTAQGQISFYLQSRYSFAQRQANAASPRYAFDVRDGNGTHLFEFLTQVTSGSLQFTYIVGGVAEFYYVPAGTENTLFGNGVLLNVTLSWSSSGLKLYLNGTQVKSNAYAPSTPNWTTASTFNLGAYQYLTVGGYNVSDDVIADFTVTGAAALTLQVPTSSGQVGTAYSSSLVAAGGTPPYTFSITSGSLPTGLTLNAGTGAITGTPSTAGTFNFTAKVTDSTSGTPLTTSLNCTITIAPAALTLQAPSGAGQVGVIYSSSLVAGGGTPPYSFSITSGSLPTGLTLHTNTGAITGTPTAPGTFSFTATVIDSTSGTPLTTSLNCTIAIAPAPLTLQAPTGAGQVGTTYSSSLVATGGTPPYTFSITAGSLPTGLNLTAGTGAITGTPTAPGTFNFTATVTDSTSGTPLTTSLNCTITIAPAPLTLQAASEAGQVGVTYSSSLSAAGGTPPYTFSITAGSLPTGLTLTAGTGAITGTPTAPGTFSFTATVTDSTSGTPLTTSLNSSITISTGPVPLLLMQGNAYELSGVTNGSIVTPAIGPSAFTGTVVANGAGSVNFASAESGNGVYFLNCCANTNDAYYKLTGTPVGNIFNTAQGQISFYLQSRYSFAQRQASAASPRYAFDVRDGNGTHLFNFNTQVASGLLQFSDVVGGVTQLYSVPAGTEDTLFGNGVLLNVTLTWSSTGLSLSLNGTQVSSTAYAPSTPNWTTASNFDLGAFESLTGGSNVSDDVIAEFTVLGAASLILQAPTSAGQVGTAYNSSLGAAGGTPPYTFSITAGSLPAGLTLTAATGAITGTPTATGTFNFTSTVTDSTSGTPLTTSINSSIIIEPAPPTLQAPTGSGQVGTAYSSSLVAAGGTPPYTFSITAGSLPTGLTLNASTGAITGTPTATGTFNFTATVTDSTSGTPLTTSINGTITIAPAPLTLQAPASTGQVGTGYSSSLVAAGGTPPYTFSITSGSLPTGLTLNTSTGAITGTPTATGTFSFTATATDSTSGTPLTTSINCTITIAPAPLTLQAPASAGQVGTAYSSSLVAAGGTPPYTFSITSGSLPTGLTLNAGTGAITGTPSTAGTFNFTAKVTDSTSGTPLTTSLNCTITIAPAALTLQAPSGAGQVGVIYSSSLVAGGGTPPYSFSITSGSLPTGLTLHTNTGAITGTPTAPGTFSFTATVIDSTSGTPLTTSLNCTIAIAPAPLTLQAPTGAGQVGTTYSSSLVATGGTPPYTFSITAGSLPTGLNLTAGTGAITGTPTAPGTFNFTATVTDSTSGTPLTTSLNCTITIAPAPLTLQAASEAGQVGVTYSSSLSAAGGTPPYTFSITAGSLPTGLTLTAGTGAITGTPTAPGTFSFTATVTDSTSGTPLTTSLNSSITISTGPVPLLLMQGNAYELSGVTNGSIVTPAIGPSAFTGTVVANGAGSVNFASAESGNGVYFLNCCANTNDAYYKLTGTPVGNIFNTAQGQISFYLQSRYSFAQRQASAASPRYAFDVRDGNGTHLFNFNTQVASGLLQFSDVVGGVTQLYSVPAGTEDTLFGNGVLLNVTLTWSSTGLSLSLNGTQVSSTAYAPSTPNWTTASNFDLGAFESLTGGSNVSDDVIAEFTVLGAASLILQAPTSAGQVGTAYNSSLGAAGGTPPYTFSITAGSLPAGLTLTAATGAITGTPTATGTFNFTSTVTDSTSGTPLTTSINSSIIIEPAPPTLQAPTGSGQVGTAYSSSLVAAGGTPPYTFSITAGSLPTGLTLNASTGAITGTPTATGTFNFTATATDSTSGTPLTTSINSSISITPAPPTLQAPTGSGQVGTGYSSSLVAAGGTPPYTFSITSGSLPTGLTLTAGTGAITGTPSASGTFNFTAKVTDSASGTPLTTSLNCTITIAPALLTLQAPASAGQVGTAYSSSLVAGGGTPPYTFSIAAGSLPTGLTLTTGTGAITGTPSAAGTFNFTAKVTDSTSGTPLTTSINISITIAPAPLMLQAPSGTGQVGTVYSSSLVAAGGTSPYTFSISAGALPAGLTLTAGTGAITGTPGAAGTFTFTAKVTDSTSGTPLTTSLNSSITIAPAPLTLHAPSGAGQVGTAYSSSLVASGGTPPYTFSITSGSLPTGLTLTASTGAITGTPSAAGTFSFAATVTDSTSGTPLTTSLNCSITISTGPVPLLLIQGGASELSGVTNGSIVTPAIGPSAFTGTVVVNGTGSVNFAPAQSGNGVYFLNCCTNTNNAYYKFAGIPVGNIFNTAQGQISFYLQSRYSFAQRQANAASPRYAFDVRDGNGTHLFEFLTQVTSGSLQFTYIVGGVAEFYYVPAGTENTLFGNGVLLNVTLSWSSSGLKLYLNGTQVKSNAYAPSTPNWTTASTFNLGAYQYLTVGGYNVSDDVIADFTVTGAAALTLQVPTSSGQVGTAYSSSLVAAGGTPPYTFSITSGSLPTGLTLNAGTGAITGTPSTAGTFNFTAKVTDSTSGTPLTTSINATITIAPAPPTLQAPTGSGQVGTAYSSSLVAAGGTAPYTFSITSGSLPTGLTLNASTGAITSTPSAAGTFNFTAKVTDSTPGTPLTTSLNCTITIVPAPLTLQAPASSGQAGTAYNSSLVAAGGTMPYHFSITAGSLPTGLTLNASSGAITGTPTAPGTFSFTAKVIDSTSGTPLTTSINSTITIAPAPLTLQAPASAGQVGTGYSSSLVAAGGTPPYTFSITSGSLPTGLTLTAGTGAITGTPSASGTFNFTAKVTDSASGTPLTTSLNCTITIAPAPLTLQAPASAGQVGTAYSSSLVAGGGTPPYTFSIAAGSLPTGLTLTTGTGAITGTPSAAGTFNFTAKVTDSTSGTPLTTSINISITIAPAPLMLQAPSGTGQVGTVYSSSLVAAGGTSPYTFSISAGALPAGLTLTAGTGAITGTPGAAGTFTFTAKVTDSTSGTPLTTSLNSSITIAPAPLTLHAPSGAGQVGTAYSSSLVASGGTPPYTFSITSGSLPTGLTLTASTGAITGTPSAAGTFSFAATVTDSTSGTPLTTSLNCSITISTGPVPLLLIQGGASELSGVTNGSIVTPAIGPSAFTGTVVVNGTGSVNFAPAQSGNGVYFLNCCTNTNNAYYKFAGIPVGNIFNTAQGQISFYLQSRYSFAQRQANAASPRYAFDVRDGNGTHLFEFLTQVTSGSLQFTYIVGGVAEFYYVPAGTENTLFGNGVLLNVTLSWSSSGLKLYLNGTQVKSNAYAPSTPNWTTASTFNLGAYQYLTVGGYNVSDDVIANFQVYP